MREDQFFSCKGTIVKLPKKIGEDSNGAPIAMLHVAVKSYRGTLPVKFWRGLAKQVLSPEIGLQVGDVLVLEGHLERRHYEAATTKVVHDDAVLLADKYELVASDVEYVEHTEVNQ